MTVFETYAIVLKQTGEPVGNIGLMFGDTVHSADIADGEAEIGYWIGVTFWGQGLIPEAGKRSPMGDIRTEHFTRLTKNEWGRIGE